MKKLKKIALHDAKELTVPQMKKISGGYSNMYDGCTDFRCSCDSYGENYRRTTWLDCIELEYKIPSMISARCQYGGYCERITS